MTIQQKLYNQKMLTWSWSKGVNIKWIDLNEDERSKSDHLNWSNTYYEELNKAHKYGYNKRNSVYSYRLTY